MELLKHINTVIRPYVRINEILDEINIKGLDADFVEIYKNIKATGAINLMPSQLFKYIEDIAQNESLPIIYEIGKGSTYPSLIRGTRPDRIIFDEEYISEWSN